MLLKYAEIVDNSSFESSFSQLARRQLQNRSQQAAEREVGFQLLDKNDEGDWAVGVFGIRTGSRLAFVPCFLMDNGQVKVDSLYLPDRDQFCPLSDKWVSAAARLDRGAIGRSMSRSETHKYPGFVDLVPFAFPQFKSAATVDRAEFAAGAAAIMRLVKKAREVSESIQVEPAPSLIDRIVSGGADGIRAFAKAARTVPNFSVTVERVHPDIANRLTRLLPEVSKESVKTAATTAAPAPVAVLPDITASYLQRSKAAGRVVEPGPRGRGTALLSRLPWVHKAAEYAKSKRGRKGPVEEFIESQKTRKLGPDDSDVPDIGLPAVIVRKGQSASMRKSGLFDGKIDEVAESISRTGRYVQDDRVKTAVVVEEQPIKLTNPSGSGVYRVLKAENEYKDMLVLMPIVTAGRAAPDRCIVLPLRSPGSEQPWTGRVRDVMVAEESEVESPRSKFQTWFESKRKVSTKLDGYGKYVFIDQAGRCTEVLRISDGPSRNDHYCVQSVREASASENSQARHEYMTLDRSYGAPYDWRDEAEDKMLQLTGLPGRGITVYDGELKIPTTAVAIKFDDMDYASPELQERGLATPLDLQSMYFGKSASLAVSKNSSDQLWIDGMAFTPQDAFDHLVIDWDLSVDTADEIIKKASNSQTGRWNYRVFPGEELIKAAIAPAFPAERQGVENGARFALPAQYPTDERSRNPSVQYQRTDYYGDENITSGSDSRILDLAAEAGPNVFDTSAISAMLRNTNEKRMIDDGIPDLYRGMNRLGRYLFQLHAHPDQLRDRYGEKDLDTFEDSLLSVFEQCGDVILFLRQTDAAPFPDGSPTDIEV